MSTTGYGKLAEDALIEELIERRPPHDTPDTLDAETLVSALVDKSARSAVVLAWSRRQSVDDKLGDPLGLPFALGPRFHPPHETHEQQHISGLQARSHGLASHAGIDQLADGSHDRCIGFVDRILHRRRTEALRPGHV